MSTTISNKLQTIYTIKNQIKEVIGTQSDVFSYYPTYIQNAIDDAGASVGGTAYLRYTTQTGFDSVSTPVYDSDDVFESMTVTSALEFGNNPHSNSLGFRTRIPYSTNYTNFSLYRNKADDLSDGSYHTLSSSNTSMPFTDIYGTSTFTVINNGSYVQAKRTEYTAPETTTYTFTGVELNILDPDMGDSRGTVTLTYDSNAGTYTGTWTNRDVLYDGIRLTAYLNNKQYFFDTINSAIGSEKGTRTVKMFPSDPDITGVGPMSSVVLNYSAEGPEVTTTFVISNTWTANGALPITLTQTWTDPMPQIITYDGEDLSIETSRTDFTYNSTTGKYEMNSLPVESDTTSFLVTNLIGDTYGCGDYSVSVNTPCPLSMFDLDRGNYLNCVDMTSYEITKVELDLDNMTLTVYGTAIPVEEEPAE